MLLFAYGTLLDSDVLSIVLDRNIQDLQFEQAHISNFLPFRVKDKDYPTLVDVEDEITLGSVIFGLTSADFQRIIHYEDGEYGLAKVPVTIRKTAKTLWVPCFNEHRSIYSDELWTDELWQQIKNDYCFSLRKAA